MKRRGKIIKRRVLIVLIPVIICCIIYHTLLNKMEIEDPEGVLEILININGIVWGFIISAIAILLSFPGNRIVNEMKKTSHYSTMMFTYFIACFCIFLHLVLCVIMRIFQIYEINTIRMLVCFWLMGVIYVFECLIILALLANSFSLEFRRNNKN